MGITWEGDPSLAHNDITIEDVFAMEYTLEEWYKELDDYYENFDDLHDDKLNVA
jgi:hypothetical protein